MFESPWYLSFVPRMNQIWTIGTEIWFQTDGRTDGRNGRTDRRTDDAKTISLRLRRGITSKSEPSGCPKNFVWDHPVCNSKFYKNWPISLEMLRVHLCINSLYGWCEPKNKFYLEVASWMVLQEILDEFDQYQTTSCIGLQIIKI